MRIVCGRVPTCQTPSGIARPLAIRSDHDNRHLPALRDPARLAALRELDLLDTPDEEAFDRLTRLAARLLGTPTAFVSLVDAERQLFKSRVCRRNWA